MDATSTKTGTTSPSEQTFNPAAVLNPASVPCKVCDAPAGGKCQNGKQYVEWFHLIRVQDATAAVPAGIDQQNAITAKENDIAAGRETNLGSTPASASGYGPNQVLNAPDSGHNQQQQRDQSKRNPSDTDLKAEIKKPSEKPEKVTR
jgi:hypothetical protein